jgi:hypothetical protein
MAKKKVVSSSASGSKRKPRAKADGHASPPRRRFLSEDQIGEVAGEIWHALAEHGGQSPTALKKLIDAPAELVLAAVGWLAREGKLEFAMSGRSVKVSLR